MSSGPLQPDLLDQARQVFLAGNGLPGRWAGRSRFVVLATGFGLGHQFLATWQAWRDDPQRAAQLVFVALDLQPASRATQQQAHTTSPLQALANALIAQWPPATPDLHLLDFDGGQVRLLLARGDSQRLLPELVLQADAVYLDGPAPQPGAPTWDEHTLRHLGRLAAPGCTLAARSTDSALQKALKAAGFCLSPGLGSREQPPMTQAVFAPRFQPSAPPGRVPQAGVRQVVVVGAGLAGAAAAQALAQQGLAVTVFEREPGPARQTSGNAGGLFHSVLHTQDGPHARWLRAAALHTARVLAPLISGGAVAGALDGLLRGERELDAQGMQALLARLGQPPEHVQVQPDALPGGQPAWRFVQGGWAAPADLVQRWLATPGITLCCNTRVAGLQRQADGRWALTGDDAQLLAQADAVVLCNAHDAQRLLGEPGWPLQRLRGQTTLLPADLPGLPRLPQPLADGGYALQLADGRLLCGAVSQAGDEDPALRAADHAQHLATLQRLTGYAAPVDPATLDGRVGWRLSADDRLPLLGPVPDSTALGPRRITQCRQVPRRAGLWLFTALGSRGLTQAALGGELLAAWLTGAPCPAPAALMDALDPARFVVRAARHADRDQR